MTFEFEYFDNQFVTFVVDGVRISPEFLEALIHPRTDIWWRCRREGNLVTVEQKAEKTGIEIQAE
jgi:hypothetical protein